MVAPIHPTAEERLARAAELRAEGSSWEAVARELGTTPEQARRLTGRRRLPPPPRRAAHDVLDDAFAEALFFARLDLRGDDEQAPPARLRHHLPRRRQPAPPRP